MITPYCRHDDHAVCRMCETMPPPAATLVGSAWQRPLIFGRGAHGELIAEVIADLDEGSGFIKVGGWLDDTHQEAMRPEDVASPRDHVVYVGIGNPITRERVTDRLRRLGFSIGGPLVHHTAYVSPSAKLGNGTVVFPNATINAHAVIGESCTVQCNAIVHHHAVLEDYAGVGPGGNVCGRTRVGRGALVGPSAVLLLNKTMGARSLLAANSTLTRNVGSWQLAMGSPARVVRELEESDWARFF